MSPTTPESFRVSRRIAARPEIVFSYFTDPGKYRLWQGIDARLDPKPGGRYEVDYTERTTVRGEYLAVEPPRRVVFTWGWESTAVLPPGIGEVRPGTSTVEVTLTPDGDGTIVEVVHLGLPTEEARKQHGTYWPVYLERLETRVAGGDPGPDPVEAVATRLAADRPI